MDWELAEIQNNINRKELDFHSSQNEGVKNFSRTLELVTKMSDEIKKTYYSYFTSIITQTCQLDNDPCYSFTCVLYLCL